MMHDRRMREKTIVCFHFRNMVKDHSDVVRCLRGKSVSQLLDFDFGTPSFLTSMGPSKDGVLIPNDFGADLASSPKRKRALTVDYQVHNNIDTIEPNPLYLPIIISFFAQVVIGLTEDETNIYFSDEEFNSGLGPSTRDKYLRTLIQNSYDYHLNEIFATVQNEYSDWMSLSPSSSADQVIRPRHLLWEASKALTDKLYVAPSSRLPIGATIVDSKPTFMSMVMPLRG